MNRIVRLLIISDIFLITGSGLVSPILAVYIKDDLVGGTLFAAGFASTLFLIVKSLVQLPFSKYADSHDSKVTFLIIGTVMMTVVPFLYMLATHVYHMYAIQVLHGIGSALAFPTFLSLFVTNLDKRREGFEWSIYSTLVGVGTAITASVGAKVAELYNFNTTFFLYGILSIVGALVLLRLVGSEGKKGPKKLAIIHKGRVLGYRHHH